MEKILIILPNWLGDAVMASPAIINLCKIKKDINITLIGSKTSVEIFKNHPSVENFYIDESKKSKFRLYASYKFIKSLGNFDIALSFRNTFYSNLMLYFSKSKHTIAKKNIYSKILVKNAIDLSKKKHLSEKYNELINKFFNAKNATPKLKIYIQKEKTSKKLLGINAGATYGSAKRWYPDRFAKLAKHFSKDFDILIFGGEKEIEISKEIEKELLKENVKNYKNLAGKTNLEELCKHISTLKIFITNDSGPMHIAAAYQIPTIAIFGPTKYEETSQWKNKYSKIIRKDIYCSPCMKRKCPLKHHKCMKDISYQEVIEESKELIKKIYNK